MVVDKPLAPDLAAADRLLHASNRSSGALTMFHNRRWDSDFLTVQKLIASQALGKLHTFESRWNRHRPQVVDRWRERAAQGGGLLLDLGQRRIVLGADCLTADCALHREAGGQRISRWIYSVPSPVVA